jgi:hypothetical protein
MLLHDNGRWLYDNQPRSESPSFRSLPFDAARRGASAAVGPENAAVRRALEAR